LVIAVRVPTKVRLPAGTESRRRPPSNGSGKVAVAQALAPAAPVADAVLV